MSRVRENLSDRITADRLRLEARRSRSPVVVILVATAVAVLLLLWVVSEIGIDPLADRQTVAFQVDTARAVVPSANEVTVKGIPAGRVGDVELRDGVAIITASVDGKLGKIYENAQARLRPSTALQDMVLDIVDRGTPSAGLATEDKPLAPSQTDTSQNIADVLQIFDPRVRESLATMLDDLGNGLDDGGARLRAAFVELAPTVAIVDRIAKQVERRQTAARRLVTNAAVLTDEIARRERAVRRLVREAGATFRTLEAGDRDLDRTLASLPSALASLETSFSTVRGVLPDIDDALISLRPTARQLPDSLEAVRGLAADAAPAVAALQEPIRRLRPFATELRPAATSLDGVITALRPQVPSIDHVTEALDRCTASKAVQNFFQWTPSVLKFEDNHGASVRGDLVFGVGSTTLARDPNLIPGKDTCTTTLPKAGTP